MIVRASKNDINEVIKLIHGRYGNVENKSGEQIRQEMTKQEIITALGYTPANNATGIESAFDEDGELSNTD